MKYKLKSMTPEQEMKCLLKMKEIMNDVWKPNWPRDQALNDNANLIVDRMIKKRMEEAFPDREVEIIKYNFDKMEPEEEKNKDINPYGMDAIMGYIEFMRTVLTWEPPPNKRHMPINLEIMYILSQKKAHIMRAIEKSVFADARQFNQLFSV